MASDIVKERIERFKLSILFLDASTHCTGMRAEMVMAKIMGDKYKTAGVGSEFKI